LGILAGFGGPVYVTPGNHDPFMPGSVWEHPAWRSSDNVHVLREEVPIDVPGGTLFPCPAREQHSAKDPTMWIPDGASRGIRVGLAHGTVEGVYQEEPDYPIPRDAAVRAALDYLAIGHWHSTATYPAPDGALRMAYSGTHETTKFGERDSGNALIVEIAEPGSAPVITPIRTGGLVWRVIEEVLREAGDLARLRERIEALENPRAMLLDLRVEGLLSAQDRDELARIEEILTSRFLFARVDSMHVRPSPSDDSWIAGLPAGALREAATNLRELADPAYAGLRPEDASPEVACRALLELYALASEGGK
jgi:DNA repair exonuclease SbcCD nuclease subunit